MHNISCCLTHEEIVCVRIGTTNLEQLHEIMKLAMYIATYSYWAFLVTTLASHNNGPYIQPYHWLYVRFFLKNFPRLNESVSPCEGIAGRPIDADLHDRKVVGHRSLPIACNS